MKRGVGLSGLQRQQQIDSKYKTTGEEFTQQNKQQVMEQLETLKNNLEVFARKYKHKINNDPEFRMQFHKMITSVGVDPLSSQKSVWSELLGVGDFYYELAVQIVQISIAARSRTGGLMPIEEMQRLLIKRRGNNAQRISIDDIERSLKSVKELGNGYDLIVSADGLQKFVQSVPLELNTDHTAVLSFATSHSGCFNVSDFVSQGWSVERVKTCVQYLLHESMIWVDKQDPSGQDIYYLPRF